MIDLIQVLKASKGLPVSDNASELLGEKCKNTVIYGWHIDPSVSDPAQAVTYLRDAKGKTPAAMGASSFSYGGWENAFFLPKPCMLKYDGTVDYYLDPNDYTKKADGTASDISNAGYNGNAMMEWGMIWFKFEAGDADGEGSFYCSNRQIDESYKCWCNINSDGNTAEHFYTSIYNAAGTNKLRSLSGVAFTLANGVGNTTAQQEISRALANNIGETIEWYTDIWCDRLLINALLVLMGRSLDVQSVFGNGFVADNADIRNYSSGALDTAGQFYGSVTGQNSFVKVFGMENWWGAIYRRAAGFVADGSTAKVKLTYGTSDGSTVSSYNTSGNGYIAAGTLPDGTSPQSVLSAMSFGSFGAVPRSVVIDADSDTYYSDSFRTSPVYTTVQGGWEGTNGSIPSRYGPENIEYYPLRVCIEQQVFFDNGSSRIISSENSGFMAAVKYVSLSTGEQISDTGWHDLPYTIDSCLNNDVIVCVTIRRSDNSALTPDDVGAVSIQLADPAYPLLGGRAGHGKKAGAFSMLLTTSAGFIGNTGTGLSCKPKATS